MNNVLYLLIAIVVIIVSVYIVYYVNDIDAKYDELNEKEKVIERNIREVKRTVNENKASTTLDESVVENLANKLNAMDTSMKNIRNIVFSNKRALERSNVEDSLNEFERKFSNVQRNFGDIRSEVSDLEDVTDINHTSIRNNASEISALTQQFEGLQNTRKTPFTYPRAYDIDLYPNVNHFRSKYIKLPRIDMFKYNEEAPLECNPRDYLIDDHGHDMTLVHLFEGVNGNTYAGGFQTRYMILDSQNIVKRGTNLHFENYEEELQEVPSEHKIRALRSISVPPHMDVIIEDDETDEKISFREVYPTQLFVSDDGDCPFFGFYNTRHGVTVYSEKFIRNRRDIDRAVGSVFLRYEKAPFSVVEFQQNEVVFWNDLLKYPGSNTNFVTNNGVAYADPVVYVPIGAGVKFLDTHNIKVHEITNSRNQSKPREYNRELQLMACGFDNNSTECVIGKDNTLFATNFNMTLRIEKKERNQEYPPNTPIFKVL